MKKPLVSIIVPIFNQEKYLRRSIPCLLAQDYRNIQIVLVNDGSTDQSDAIIKEYKNVDDRIKVVNKSNGGLVDATITGIRAADGEYIAFLDPDDYIGTDFIHNFVKELDQDYDFIACGFYYDRCGSLSPYMIENTLIYEEDAIKKLEDTYLYSKSTGKISQEIFFSRWNKLYQAETVKKALETFERCREITLGEDTIFTYLLLKQSTKGKSVKGVNSYYYNTSNPNSMMKDKNITEYLKKARRAYTVYLEILKANNGKEENAFALYFFLVESLFSGVNQHKSKFRELYGLLKKDAEYQKAIKYICVTTSNPKQRIDMFARMVCPSSAMYFLFHNDCIHLIKKMRDSVRECKTFLRDCGCVGIRKGLSLKKFRALRRMAFIDLYENMSEMDSRISAIIRNLDLKPEQESVEHNVFVFWWDGFEAAPDIVKKCLRSVERNYRSFKIIQISKYNYNEYTDIDPLIIKGFERGKVSVQTFSDILRFNLLKNNGGMWIDATIFFLCEYDLINKLDVNQSFNTLEFTSSGDFLKYKNYECSWSGFFIASKKNGLFVRTMDAIFREYYKIYGTYTLYFFIDAAFMICKINGVDNNVLMKSQKCSGDMFLLSKIGNCQFDESLMAEISKLPQKLAWNTKLSGREKTFYTMLLK